ncbi:hypothetical protein EDB80DRAFT_223566 [Ilyonectria destructans]|nr:hypothetical protein EDB80DRAFT_223566 [Ilyonectria destructans]
MCSLPPFRGRRLKWVQSHLGKDKNGRLCLIRPEPYAPRIVPPDEPYILSLPDEILAFIVENISLQLKYDRTGHSRKARSTYGDLAAVALVCHRFNRIAVPFLYTYIQHLSDDGEWTPGRLHHDAARQRLHETLRARKDLRLHCRRLNVEFGFGCRLPASDFGSVAADYASWLVNTKVLRTYGFFNFDSVADMAINMLSTASHNMRQLEAISIFRQTHGKLHLYDLYECLRDAPSSLVTLHIHGCPSAETPDYPFNERLLAANISNQSPVRNLHLSNAVDHPRIVAAFIAWVGKLEHFSLDLASNELRSPHWNLSVVADILAPHREYLRTLTIGKLCQPGLGNFDASSFPKLEKLALHPKDLDGVDPKACSRLQTPMLKEVAFTEY